MLVELKPDVILVSTALILAPGETFRFYTIPSRSILQAPEHGWPISFDVLVEL